jgi:hypothetical protein
MEDSQNPQPALAPDPNPTPPVSATPPPVDPTPPANTAEPTPAVSAPAPKQKSKLLKVILIITGVTLLLLGAIFVFVLISTLQTGKHAEGFVNELKSSNYEAAYEYFAPELKEAQSFDVFQTQVKTLNLTEECEDLNITERETKTDTEFGTLNKVIGTVKCPDASYKGEFIMGDSDGEEKLYSYFFIPETTAQTAQ